MGETLGAKEIAQGPYSLHVVFNNVACKTGLTTSWGFACLIKGPDKTILFDTGGNGDILLANMTRRGLNPRSVDAIVISHLHGDHTGGLGVFLSYKSDITVYVPASFPSSFLQGVQGFGAAVERVTGPQCLMPGIYSTGEMGTAIKEQGLILDTEEGLVLITGCAHPNVVHMAEQAKTYLDKNLFLVMGGFHLGSKSDPEISGIIKRLKELGVQKVGPSHCTGENAMGKFRKEWGDDFIEAGLGAVITVP